MPIMGNNMLYFQEVRKTPSLELNKKKTPVKSFYNRGLFLGFRSKES